MPVLRYGHCRFEAAEALVSLVILVLEFEGLALGKTLQVLPTAKARARSRALARAHRLRPPSRTR